jgi:hypothetical protein
MRSWLGVFLDQPHRANVEALAEAIKSKSDDAHTTELVGALRRLVKAVVLYPLPHDYEIELQGKLGAFTDKFLPELSGGTLVAEEGFEPPTHGL